MKVYESFALTPYELVMEDEEDDCEVGCDHCGKTGVPLTPVIDADPAVGYSDQMRICAECGGNDGSGD